MVLLRQTDKYALRPPADAHTKKKRSALTVEASRTYNNILYNADIHATPATLFKAKTSQI